MTTETNIRQLVAKLPECYQPIFGFPQISLNVSRQCDDRLAVIRASLESLVKYYDRPLRLLDLGCAQGFFALSVADICESVQGIDFLSANVDVCNAVRDAAGLSNVRFNVGEISAVIGGLKAGQYDVVLGLSVFHHLCHSQGWPQVAALLKNLASVVDVQVLELAEATEPLYWAPSLPADAYDLIRQIGFIYPLGTFATHLGDVARTLYFSSDRVWSLGRSVQYFERWTEQSHEFAGEIHRGTRRYFFSDNAVAKTYRFIGPLAEHNRTEFRNELRYFQDLAPRVADTFPSPQLISVGSVQTFGHLVTGRIEGETLAKVILSGADFDPEDIIRQILAQLVQLETKSLYHRDVRVWNVLVDEAHTARLIDFGAIGENASDNVWPFDLFASFLIFVGEVASKAAPRVHLFRRPMLSSAWLREPFRSWFDSIWAQPHSAWSFAGFLRLLDDAKFTANHSARSNQIHADNWALWRGISERLLSEASDAFHLEREVIAARITREESQRATKALSDIQQRLDEAENELSKAEMRSARFQAELAAVFGSLSWRVTKPLRAVKPVLKRITGKIGTR